MSAQNHPAHRILTYCSGASDEQRLPRHDDGVDLLVVDTRSRVISTTFLGSTKTMVQSNKYDNIFVYSCALWRTERKRLLVWSSPTRVRCTTSTLTCMLRKAMSSMSVCLSVMCVEWVSPMSWRWVINWVNSSGSFEPHVLESSMYVKNGCMSCMSCVVVMMMMMMMMIKKRRSDKIHLKNSQKVKQSKQISGFAAQIET